MIRIEPVPLSCNGNAEMVTEGLKIENGYVTMELTVGGNYILTTQKLVEKNHGRHCLCDS